MNSVRESGKRGTMMRNFSGKALQEKELFPKQLRRRMPREKIAAALSVLMLSVCGCESRTEPLIGREDGLSAQPGQAGTAGENGQAGTARENGQAGTAGENGQATQPGQEAAAKEPEQLLYVYVCGAVESPGVVALAPGSRVEDALKAAGGFAEEADRNGVNLADWVTDGERLYFPAEGEAEVPEAAGASAQKSAGLVNINSAGTEELCTLPGIGEARAADIISYREKNGGFGSVEDIMKVPGIKTGAYGKIKDRITVK